MTALSSPRPRSSGRPVGGRLSRFARPVGHGLILAGLMLNAYLIVSGALSPSTAGFDAFAYWNVSLPDPYSIPLGELGSFNYAPPVALVFDHFDVVDWPTFLLLWSLLLIGAVIWIGRKPQWILAAFAVPFVAIEIHHGNIHILLAAAIVLGFRHPWTWAFVLLTKPTCGVGLLWFVVRREWHSLAIALGATALLSMASWLVMPSLWAEWIDYLVRSSGTTPGIGAITVPLWLRLPPAVLLVIWGARTDRRWTVVVSACLALPALWVAGLAMLIGVIPDLRERAEARGLATQAGHIGA